MYIYSKSILSSLLLASLTVGLPAHNTLSQSKNEHGSGSGYVNKTISAIQAIDYHLGDHGHTSLPAPKLELVSRISIPEGEGGLAEGAGDGAGGGGAGSAGSELGKPGTVGKGTPSGPPTKTGGDPDTGDGGDPFAPAEPTKLEPSPKATALPTPDSQSGGGKRGPDSPPGSPPVPKRPNTGGSPPDNGPYKGFQEFQAAKTKGGKLWNDLQHPPRQDVPDQTTKFDTQYTHPLETRLQQVLNEFSGSQDADKVVLVLEDAQLDPATDSDTMGWTAIDLKNNPEQHENPKDIRSVTRQAHNTNQASIVLIAKDSANDLLVEQRLFLSELTFYSWKQVCEADNKDIKGLRKILSLNIQNEMTQKVIDPIIRVHGTDELTFQSNSAEFLALLGTPNGMNVGRMLKDHNQALGLTIQRVSMIPGVPDDTEALSFQESLLWELGPKA